MTDNLNRKSQLSFLLSIVLILLMYWHPGQASAEDIPKIIKAQEFVLTDESGNPKAGLATENGNPVFYLLDKSGVVRAYISVVDKGPVLVFRDNKQQPRMYIRLNEDNSPTIAFLNHDNKPVMMASVKTDKNPGLIFYDKNGNGRIAIGIDGNNPALAFVDSRQQPQVLIQARDGQGALVSLHDGKNEPTVAMGLREGRSFVYAYDRDKSGFFAGAQSGKGPAMALKERGKVAWAAGAGGDVKALEQGLDATGFGMDLLR